MLEPPARETGAPPAWPRIRERAEPRGLKVRAVAPMTGGRPGARAVGWFAPGVGQP